MGIGDGVIPEILHQDVYEEIVIVTDEEALEDGQRAGGERRTDVRDHRRDSLWRRRFGWPKEAGKGEDGGHDSSGYGGAVFFYGTVCVAGTQIAKEQVEL